MRTNEQIADLLRHAAETLREDPDPGRGTSRCSNYCRTFDGIERSNGPRISDLIRDLECAAFELERAR